MIINELNKKDIEIILNNHNVFFNAQRTLNINFRIESLKKLKNAIKNFEYEITEALYKDLGKSEFESYATEIGFVLSSIEHTIKNIKKWSKPKRVSTPIHLFPTKSEVIKQPYGVVLIMGPYNYPFQLLMEPLIGAIAAGNCVVLKPSEVSPNVSSIVKKLIDKTFDSNYISCLEGSIETNTSLINSKFDYIFFTGSVLVGKIVMEAAAKNLVPVTLELGGKSPVIVDKTANINVAASRIMWGKTMNAGQTCIAPDYVLVDKNIKDKLIIEMKNSLKEFYGVNIQESNDFGRIINDRHFNRLKSVIEKDKDKIIFGGNYDENSKYIEPTLLDIDSFDAASMQEELFGPILPIIDYENIDDAIEYINKNEKPLALYLFAEDKNIEVEVLNRTQSGGVSINDTISHIINPKLPFGGIGNSGMGAYHGKYSFDTFSHERSIIKKSSKINITIAYPPFNQKKLKYVKKFLK
ncbi:aldehyde dehydrogenase [Romboutsia weinsteinii]|uniref:Aldehyde dehydrogenase n=1 Tax=Romboutsia weinsteinii TaxID=2020949 RepID=A0A371J3C4_9FIRM|nr:aldehyde dehydrogenase [Romboutsia weinsteinii]RDY27290.1 aldehyde dehydrogenase [Romboutsia weinsteinii]